MSTPPVDAKPIAAKDEKKWSVLVFMGADNPDGQSDLSRYADEDIVEMEQALAAAKAGTPRTLEIAYQVYKKEGVKRRRLGGVEEHVQEKRDKANDGSQLSEFVVWALTETGHRPGDYLMLILWGHTHQFGIGARDVRGETDALDFAELAGVLERLKKAVEDYHPNSAIDIIAFDSCDASTLEMAYQLRHVSRYLLASQIRMPLPGLPYKRTLERLACPQGRLMGPAELGRWTVRRFCEHYSAAPPQSETVSLTLLALASAPAVVERADRLARALLAQLDAGGEDVEFILNLFQLSRVIDRTTKPYVDVADLCLNLVLHCESDEVKEAAQLLGNSLLSPAPIVGGGSELGRGVPFVVEHGRNACTTARLNGVSLYAPHLVGVGDAVNDLNRKYKNFVFADDTLWDALVTALAQA